MTAKFWTFLITTLLLVTGCSKSEVVTTYEQEVAKQEYVKQQPTQQEVNNSPVPVVFDVASGNQATTRALTTEDILKQDGNGFGVFGYYTNGAYPVPNTTVIPNFMYNQRVYWDTDAWTYTPVKYWPNDFSTGAVDNQDPAATGSANDKLSFFAYAPYVPVNIATGAAKNPDESIKTTGIVGLSLNSDNGDPLVNYQIGAGSEDLLWSALLNQTKTTGAYPDYAVNTPTFSFSHALTALTFEVGAYFDETPSMSHTQQIADGTYITIDRVDIVSTNLPYQGWLNLRTGVWTDLTTGSGSTALMNGEIAEHVRYKADATAPYSTPSTTNMVNPGVGRGDDGTPDAAATTYPLLKDGQYLVMIPSTGLDLDIICTYYVWTFDSRNGDGISKVKNVVKDSLSDLTLETGKAYTITLRLGMRSVKLNVKQYKENDGSGAANPEIWPSSEKKKDWNLPFDGN